MADPEHCAATARQIAEALIPPALRCRDWEARWDTLEQYSSPTVSDGRIGELMMASDRDAGDVEADALATASLIRDMDV